MADLLDRDPEEILREARAHMNPTVYDRGRVSQKLAATRRTWDGQSGVDGVPLPDPFSTGAKFAAAAGKLGSWKVLAGGVLGIMLATGGAYLALSGSSSAVYQPTAAKQAPASVPPSEPEEIMAPSSPVLDVGPARLLPPTALEPSAIEAKTAPERPASELTLDTISDDAVGTENKPARPQRDARRVRASKPSTARVLRDAALSRALAGTQDDFAQQSATPTPMADENLTGLPAAVELDDPKAPDLPNDAPVAKPQPPDAPQAVIDPLLEDLSLLKRAAETLYRGDARSAESLLREHARRFPKSQTRFERYALGFATACALGDIKTADEHRTTLLHEAPRGALSARVRAGCGKSQP